VVFVYLTQDGKTGMGEAAPSKRYGESFDQILSILGHGTFSKLTDTNSLDKTLDELRPLCQGCNSLEAAVDMAAHDLWGKIEDKPLFQKFGLNGQEMPVTSFTIGIDSPDVIQEKVKEAEKFPILKVKLGTGSDKEIIREVRKVTGKPIRVDANEGWNLEEAKNMCDWLSSQNVEFVEQPLPANKLSETAILKETSTLKLIADENSLTASDIPELENAFHGINIKLMKCGGVDEANKMIETAKNHKLEVMLGCMVESSLSVTAAAHLSPLVDYADLDGNLLITNDPFEGVKVDKEGRLVLPSNPGLGVTMREQV
jgi:L-alanine-DL-glutamate epimerase-like enolase superfamily enzyme|tara:strand:+ start:3719 stop:4660 length:942 start_codon:yes stop_codon:yes gene_type:complete